MTTFVPLPASSTLHGASGPSTEAQAPIASASRTPALLVVGDAALGGAPARGEPRVLPIPEQGLAIGRAPEALGGGAAWRLTHRRASSRHAFIQRAGTTVVLEDVGSTNGTLVNGRRIGGPTPLADGALLFFGGHAAVFRWLASDDVAALAEADAQPLGPLPTASPVLAAAEAKLRRLATSDHEILLVGETGAGKEVYAEAVHHASGRKGPFVAINCAALPGELVESELFGYVRGAHSQASVSKRGLIEEAEGGTLFLDEIGDMPQAAQAKLLRFLQNREIVPLGATRPRRVDVRVLAATSRPGGGNGSPGLREDLVGRMGAAAFTLPSLRLRREDVGALVAFFLAKVGPRPLEPALFLAFCVHPWPRNVRELKKVVETAALLAGDAPELTLAHVPPEIASLLTPSSSAAPSSEADDAAAGFGPVGTEAAASRQGAPDPSSGRTSPETERRRSPRPIPGKAELEALLTQHKGNVAEVARALDRHWKVIKRALDRHGIDAERFRA